VSPSAYADALEVLGQENTAIVIACILQRATHSSAGGYLRVLIEKATAGEFSVGPMLMAAPRVAQGRPTKRGRGEVNIWHANCVANWIWYR
jgi:replication initiation protein RepC